MSKTCTSCPSLLESSDASQRFGKATGAAMCGRYGYVLERPNADQSERLQALAAFASECDAYGKELPGTPVSISPRVATLNEEIIEDGPTGLVVGSCFGCSNCVKHTTVMQEHGWPVPICKAKGTLILNPQAEAKGCEWAKPGAAATTMYDVELRKEFRADFFTGAEVNVDAILANGNLDNEPTTYPSDAEVDPDDLAEGIRAWRKLTCPFGTDRVVFLPIFESNLESPNCPFTRAEVEMIPQTGGPHMPELYMDYGHLVWRFAVEEWMLGQTLLIQSFPGLGKTELAYYLGWLMQVPVTRIFFTDSIEWDDVFGKPGFSPDEGTFWMDGRFTASVKRPGIILVDEPNMAKSEIVATLRTTTELDPTIYLDAGYARDDGERLKLEVKPHKYNFRIWAANPAWDPRNIGTKELAAADISRISPAYLDYPPVDVERRIIRTQVMELDGFEIPEALLDDLMKVSADIREAAKPENGDFPGTWGIRENVKVARKLAWYPFVEAFRMATLNYYEPAIAAFIIDNSIKTIRAEDIRR